MLEELRRPSGQEEADILYGAIRALGNVRGDFVNFITPSMQPKFTWEQEEPDAMMAPQRYYTVRREPVGGWRLENGEVVPVLQVKQGKDVVMNFSPDLEKIVSLPQ